MVDLLIHRFDFLNMLKVIFTASKENPLFFYRPLGFPPKIEPGM